MENICLASINYDDNINKICCRKCKNNKYPFCKMHYNKRFKTEEYNILELEQKQNLCSIELKTGKNQGKICSSKSIKNNICYSHLKLELGICYDSTCNNIAFYKNGYCSFHLKNNCCPCFKHSVDKETILSDKFYCLIHKDTDCDCLIKLKKNKINFNIPLELIEYIFSYLDVGNYSLIKTLNTYFKYKPVEQLLSKNYLQKDLYLFNTFNDSVLLEKEINIKIQNIFDLILEKIGINTNDTNIIKINYHTNNDNNNSIVIVYHFREINTISRKRLFIKNYILLQKDIPIFIDNLKSIYYLYLSNYALILTNKIFIDYLNRFYLHYDFYIANNFENKIEGQNLLDLHIYLSRKIIKKLSI